MKRILITGKDSYIGTSFEKWMQQYGDTYHIDTIDVRGDAWKNHNFEGYDVVFHVAGIAHVKETKANRELYYEVNRDLAYALALKARNEHVSQLIFLSSMSVYGVESGIITKETSPYPKSAYGKSKLEAERLISELKDDNFCISIIRPPMVYGPGCKGNYLTLSQFAKKTKIFPDINNARSMIYIDNLSFHVKNLIDKCASGIFLPQNKEYVDTTMLVKCIAEFHGNHIYLTKLCNPIIKNLKLKILEKIFGSLVYKMTDACNIEYTEFMNTIKKTEGYRF